MPDDLSQDQYVGALPRDDRGRPRAGDVALVRRIGVGGMGAVYRGEHPRLGTVAVKILPFTLIEKEPSLKDRFLAEGRTASSLSSPHVVRVHAVGVEGATHYLVMEFVDGESAAARLERAGAGGLPEAEAVDIAIAAVRGLAEAHAHGIVHRDLKPANVLIPGGRAADAKLADLGLARPLAGDGTVGTASSVTLGSPGFIAPEQALDSRKADRRSDVFSAGATLYALLTGTPPFRGATAFGALMEAALKDPDPLPETVSAPVRTIVARCLSKESSRRYADAGELLAALEEARGARPAAGPRSILAKAALAAGILPLVLLVVLIARQREPEPQERLRLVLAPGVAMEFVRIRPGTFTMGEAGVEDDETPHAVTIGRAFWMQTTEVTQAQWETLMGANPSAWRGADRPVDSVSWNECREFVERVAARAGRAASLPTEAEWEYACRAGTTTRWHTGDAPESLGAACWYGEPERSATHAVGGKAPNAWGLYDMHGNVWEWCADWYDDYPEKAVVDPTGPPAGRSRIKRGGCAESAIESTRSANRGYNGPLHRDEALGLRVVLR
jgi:formylglycine-generating enzyme required for sulfatase activity